MKSVLISIRHKLVEKIANSEKAIEVRKSAPKEVPFKCYIYCTIGNGVKGDYLVPSGIQCGKVIGEFVCDKVIKTCGWRLRGDTQQCAKRTTDEEAFPELACLTIDEIVEYAGSENREVCGWHISDLKIYDKPKELSEFGQKCDNANEIRCRDCRLLEEWDNCCSVMCKPLTRAPSNWCYVEELPK